MHKHAQEHEFENFGFFLEMRTTEEHDKKPEEPGSETDSSLGK